MIWQRLGSLYGGSSTRWIRLGIAAALFCALALLWLGWPEEAFARIGGGQNYGRGGSSGGGGGGGGSSDGVPIELIYILVRLCIEYPALGIPLTIVFVVFLAARHFMGSGVSRQVHRTHSPSAPSVRATASREVPGLARLRAIDPTFSMPVLQDYLLLVHRRAHEAIGNRDWETLAPFVHDSARNEILASHKGVSSVSEVVVGAVRVFKVQFRGDFQVLSVRFESTQVEVLEGDKTRRVLIEETWKFRRGKDARSLPPEKVQRLGCPSCGASIESTPMGACPQCGTAITAGQLQWQAVRVRVVSRKRVSPPKIGTWEGGVESSVHEPSRVASDLAARQRELLARHPDFEIKAFRARVEEIYLNLQTLWSAGEWEALRPWVTDPMYQSLRFWIEGYTRHGLRNRLVDVKLLRLELIKIEVDPWYEAITVRLWGSMKDAVVNDKGEVVGGNPKTERSFSEYWTFLRAAGSGGEVHKADACPSCGAPLDRISQTGICGYCDSKITTGQFDWVLSRIEQPEAYLG